MFRLFLLVVAWIAYVGLLFTTTICIIAGSAYFLPFLDFSTSAIAAGMDLAVYSAGLLALPILLRWKLRNATWGTFAIYAFLLGTAIALQGLLEQIRGAGWFGLIIILVGVLVLNSSLVFMTKHVRHIEAIWRERKRSSPQRKKNNG